MHCLWFFILIFVYADAFRSSVLRPIKQVKCFSSFVTLKAAPRPEVVSVHVQASALSLTRNVLRSLPCPIIVVKALVVIKLILSRALLIGAKVVALPLVGAVGTHLPFTIPVFVGVFAGILIVLFLFC